jgi:hypothetical protein
MKDDLLEQYKSIRITIKANVQTIGRLIEQAEGLKKFAGGVQEPTVKAELDKQVCNLTNTINQLIAQTDDLFDKYSSFVEGVFTKK